MASARVWNGRAVGDDDDDMEEEEEEVVEELEDDDDIVLLPITSSPLTIEACLNSSAHKATLPTKPSTSRRMRVARRTGACSTKLARLSVVVPSAIPTPATISAPVPSQGSTPVPTAVAVAVPTAVPTPTAAVAVAVAAATAVPASMMEREANTRLPPSMIRCT